MKPFVFGVLLLVPCGMAAKDAGAILAAVATHARDLAACHYEGTLEKNWPSGGPRGKLGWFADSKGEHFRVAFAVDADAKQHRTRSDINSGFWEESVFDDGQTFWLYNQTSNSILKTNATPSVLNSQDPNFRIAVPDQQTGSLGPATVSRWLSWILLDRWNSTKFNSNWHASRPESCPLADAQAMCWVLRAKREAVWIDQHTGWVVRYDFAKTSLRLSKIEEGATHPSADRFVPPSDARITSDIVTYSTPHALERAAGFPVSQQQVQAWGDGPNGAGQNPVIRPIAHPHHSLEEYLNNKPVVLFFCVSWFQACSQQLAVLEKLRNEDSIDPAAMLIIGTQGLEGVIENAPDGPRKIPTSSHFSELVERVYCRGALAPTTWIITRGGTLIHGFVGTVDEATLQSAILEAITWPSDKEAPERRVIE
jgi:hypothetical protein